MGDEWKAYPLHMGMAKCAVDLGDGSERGEYVNQDYILQTLGRPHRSISLMYCYYPFDEGWPGRVSVVHKNPDVSFAWGYPYDDYFTYKGGLNGNTEGEPFTFMRDVRRHGQDVTLTMTVDPHVTDEHLIAIAKDLRPFGRMMLRINHECTGDWFSFTKRSTYKEIGEFYSHFCKILKEHAPNVQTILCTGGVDAGKTEIEKEDCFAQPVRDTDMWSIDKYFALHWGWPYDVAERGGNSHSRGNVREIYEYTKRSYERFKELNGGVEKPMMMSELNADGDVVGPYDQVEMVQEFCDLIKKDNATWFTSFSMYQFRDRGRLGLEIEDPNNPEVGIAQPLLAAYRQIIHDDYFKPQMTQGEKEVSFPAKLRWGGAEDADGLAIPVHFDGNPHFCELYFEDESNLMIEVNGRWFYKSPKAKVIDLMSAFYEKPLTGAADLTIKLFAPPASGENDLSAPDGLMNVYTTIGKLPKLRVRFEPVEK